MARIVGVYELPIGLGLTASCFGKRVRASVGGRSVTIALPSIEWTKDDRPHLVSPAIPHLPTTGGQGIAFGGRAALEEASWGEVGQWNSREKRVPGAWLESVAIELSLPDGSFDYLDSLRGLGPPHGGSVGDFFREVDGWFEELLTWVGVAVNQDTDHRAPLSSASVRGQGLTIRAIRNDGEISSPTSATEVEVVSRTVVLVNLTVFRKLISLVSHGSVPHDAHLLVRDAWMEQRRGRTRRAAIDAGSAVELVLAQWNAAGRNLKPSRGHATLGWLVSNVGAQLPASTYKDLVVVRNDAIHKHLSPSSTEAGQAVALADSIVRSLEPLPL